MRRQRGGAGPLALPGIRPRSAGAPGRRFRLGPLGRRGVTTVRHARPHGGLSALLDGVRRYLCLQHGFGAALGRPGGANPQPGVPRGLPHDVRPARRRCDRALCLRRDSSGPAGDARSLGCPDASRPKARLLELVGADPRPGDRSVGRGHGTVCGGPPHGGPGAAAGADLSPALRRHGLDFGRAARAGADRCGGRGRSPAHPVARL